MDGQQLKRWREHRRLTQDQLAAHLGWTRQRLANVENDRTSFAEDISPMLGAWDASNQITAPPGQAPKKTRYDYSAHKCWDLYGRPITFEQAVAQPYPGYFYRLDNTTCCDETTGHQLANLYVTSRRAPRGQGLYFHLDLVTGRVKPIAWADHPAHIKTLAELNALLAQGRQASEQVSPSPMFTERTDNAENQH